MARFLVETDWMHNALATVLDEQIGDKRLDLSVRVFEAIERAKADQLTTSSHSTGTGSPHPVP